MDQFDWQAYQKKVQWFCQSRFGMFIHWGLYAIPARGEWVRSEERLTLAEYQPYLAEFNADQFDAATWAKAAKAAGMQYAVLTAKHHDGFCLFDSALTDYKSSNTPCGRDIVREFLQAFRAEGLRVGLYYSLIDWQHPDYPHYGDLHHPMRDNPAFQTVKHDFNRYLTYMHAQVEELCKNYGKIDLFWFDFSYGDLRGEAWKATELVRMIRSYQPDVLIDNRLEVSGEGFGSLISREPSAYCGDFVSPEQIIPPQGIVNQAGAAVPWEACVTMNNHWGYTQQDKHFKSSKMLIQKLVECVSKNGNLLCNVGPNARGVIPAESLAILAEVGSWMQRNSASIYGCGAAGLPKHEYGRITAKGNKLYFHFTEAAIGYLPLPGLCLEDIQKIRLLADGSELQPIRNWVTNNYADVIFVSFGDDPNLPESVDTVIEVELKSR